MSIDLPNLVAQMTAAATTAARGQAKDLEAYISERVQLIANGIVAIASDLAAGNIAPADAQFAFSQIKESEATNLLAVEVTVKDAAQDAINAALSVAAGVASKALGVAII